MIVKFKFKKITLALLVLITTTVFAADTLEQPENPQEPPITVAVSIPPQRYFLEQIGGHHVNVLLVVPKGFEPEDYAPKPQQLKALTTAKLYFAIDVPFEKTWLHKFQSVNPHLSIIQTELMIQKAPMPSSHPHGKRARHHEIKDPHIWLSPTLVRLQAIAIRDALIHADPKNAQDYRANYFAFSQKITQLDQSILTLFSQKRLKGKDTFFVFHPAWGYFSRDYGLKQIAIEREGKAPTIKQLTNLIKEAKLDKVNTIFISPEFSKKSAEAIASAVDARVSLIDPLAEQWDKSLLHAAQAIAASFND